MIYNGAILTGTLARVETRCATLKCWARLGPDFHGLFYVVFMFMCGLCGEGVRPRGRAGSAVTLVQRGAIDAAPIVNTRRERAITAARPPTRHAQ